MDDYPGYRPQGAITPSPPYRVGIPKSTEYLTWTNQGGEQVADK